MSFYPCIDDDSKFVYSSFINILLVIELCLCRFRYIKCVNNNLYTNIRMYGSLYIVSVLSTLAKSCWQDEETVPLWPKTTTEHTSPLHLSQKQINHFSLPPPTLDRHLFNIPATTARNCLLPKQSDAYPMQCSGCNRFRPLDFAG